MCVCMCVYVCVRKCVRICVCVYVCVVLLYYVQLHLRRVWFSCAAHTEKLLSCSPHSLTIIVVK